MLVSLHTSSCSGFWQAPPMNSAGPINPTTCPLFNWRMYPAHVPRRGHCHSAKCNGDDPVKRPIDPYAHALVAIWKKRIASGEVPTGSQLADVLVASAGEPLPGWLVEHLCRHLRGEIRRKPGPKPREPIDEINEIAVTERYDRLLAWLQKRRKTRGLAGWSCIRDQKWWQGAPHERAIGIIHARFKKFRHIDTRRLANVISSRRSRG